MHALESGISAVAGIAAYLLREAIAFDCFATADLLFHLCHDAPTLRFTHLMNTLAGLQSRAAVEWPAVANRLFEQAPQCNTVALIALDWSRARQPALSLNSNTMVSAYELWSFARDRRHGPAKLPTTSRSSCRVILGLNKTPFHLGVGHELSGVPPISMAVSSCNSGLSPVRCCPPRHRLSGPLFSMSRGLILSSMACVTA